MLLFLIAWLLFSSILMGFKIYLFPEAGYPRYFWFLTLPIKPIESIIRFCVSFPIIFSLGRKDPTILDRLQEEINLNKPLREKKLLVSLLMPLEPIIYLLTGFAGVYVSYILIILGKF